MSISQSIIIGADSKPRCRWAKPGLDEHYHDHEWAGRAGKPDAYGQWGIRDDRDLFELICLEGAQAGLSWSTILAKRQGYRMLFHNFDIARVAEMTAKDVDRIVLDASIVRHRGKIQSVLGNAEVALKVQAEHGSLAAYLWSFAPTVAAAKGHRKLTRKRPATMADIATTTPESDAMSKALKKLGFKFVGSTICYALMQATGMVDDHVAGCWCSKR